MKNCFNNIAHHKNCDLKTRVFLSQFAAPNSFHRTRSLVSLSLSLSLSAVKSLTVNTSLSKWLFSHLTKFVCVLSSACYNPKPASDWLKVLFKLNQPTICYEKVSGSIPDKSQVFFSFPTRSHYLAGQKDVRSFAWVIISITKIKIYCFFKKLDESDLKKNVWKIILYFASTHCTRMALALNNPQRLIHH